MENEISLFREVGDTEWRIGAAFAVDAEQGYLEEYGARLH